MPLTSISLIGNPNCGKTTLFNALTGARQKVGNWPGVTVERKSGRLRGDTALEVIDLPGTYSIEGGDEGVSEDERIARDHVLAGTDGLIVNVLDAANLQRNLFLTFQLLDLGRPMLVVLNMVDALESSGHSIDIPALQQALGCPVLAICANRGKGVAELVTAIQSAAARAVSPCPQPTLAGDLERWLQAQAQAEPAVSRAIQSARLLEGTASTLPDLAGEDADIALASARYSAIDLLCARVLRREHIASPGMTARLDRFALGRLTGLPVFLLAMYLMFLLAINAGAVFIDFFDLATGTLLVDGTAHLLSGMGAPAWLVAVLAHGIGGGIQTVSTFIPVIAAMFLCLSFMEDSGYLARAAMVVDRAMRAVGLPGKAFVPMLVGFGCNVPAIMGTRTLDSSRDRLTAIMMMPFMSCGARLPVYVMFAAVFFPSDGQNVVFALYLLGIAIAVLTGLAMKHSLLSGEISPFVMELPPYRLPTLKGMLIHSWQRLKSFIVRAGKAIVAVVMVLSLFNSLGADGSFGNENTEASLLSATGRVLTPVFTPMGITQDNWPATVGLFTGIFAKEAVVGTLDSLYGNLARAAAGHEDEPAYDMAAGLHAAVASVADNLASLGDKLTDPLGLSVGDLADRDAIAEEQGVDTTTFGQMQMRFGGAAAALAYLVFILLYTPCVAALGAVYREAGARWMAGVGAWCFVIAWSAATLTYQGSRLATAPATAGLWIAGVLGMLGLGFLLLRYFGRQADVANTLPAGKAKACASGSCAC
ncbi:Fe(2+) transporter permease subunit FeoB [Craterilacuibacter sp. RT1T]|uniref:Fe(2+) transporter permease subunit FeoB n=1 Tax=Craterilacuibacter sp. RT1T TaxID=2942211 RepID=UPI0020BF1E05|nr:Fe(2+) transporter permease subunit FeoB [Craterilacuibacter sp. RT1T]MCL6264357.1 Fe(2+) transporter permease subunit FeoB [Craterilacuibacter sp. RT1T]